MAPSPVNEATHAPDKPHPTPTSATVNNSTLRSTALESNPVEVSSGQTAGEEVAVRRNSTTKSVTFAEPAAYIVTKEDCPLEPWYMARGVLFADDTDTTRCLEVDGLNSLAIVEAVEHLHVKVEHLMAAQSGNRYFIYLDDIRGAENMMIHLKSVHPACRCNHVHPQTMAPGLGTAEKSLAMSIYNGQLVVTTIWVNDEVCVNYREMFDTCYNMVESYGPVRSFRLLSRKPTEAEFRVEFFKLSSVDLLLKSTGVRCHHLLPPNVSIMVSFYHPNGPCADPPRDPASVAELFGSISRMTILDDSDKSSPSSHSMNSMAPPRARASAYLHDLPHGPANFTFSPDRFGGYEASPSHMSRLQAARAAGRRGSTNIDASGLSDMKAMSSQDMVPSHPQLYMFEGGPVEEPQLTPIRNGSSRGGFTNGARRGRHGHGDSSHPGQTVDVAAIENGQDVRTTLMLRNLPNRLSYWDVQKMLYQTSKGVIDFLYVRIDFSSGLNVGYGFVNFIAPEHIIPFLKTSVGRPWAGFDNNKVLEISYATIQGQDCLIQKFRNSSVLKECDGYTPKIFYTIGDDIPHGKSPGDDYKFPEPDNQQKFARSLDNARTIGLYSKDARSNRDARRPRSQYDRGTPRAVHDEAVAAARGGGARGQGRALAPVGNIGPGAIVPYYPQHNPDQHRCNYPSDNTRSALDPRVPAFCPNPEAAFYRNQSMTFVPHHGSTGVSGASPPSPNYMWEAREY